MELGGGIACRPLTFIELGSAVGISSSELKTFRENVMSMFREEGNLYDLNAILNPGSVFDHPREVLDDPTLSRSEKRAILASWASDAAAVTSNPALRRLTGAGHAVTIDEILEALSSLDRGPRHPPGGKPARLRSTERAAA